MTVCTLSFSDENEDQLLPTSDKTSVAHEWVFPDDNSIYCAIIVVGDLMFFNKVHTTNFVTKETSNVLAKKKA